MGKELADGGGALKGAQGLSYLSGLSLGACSRLLPPAERLHSRAVFKPPWLLAPSSSVPASPPPYPPPRPPLPDKILGLQTSIVYCPVGTTLFPGLGGSDFPWRSGR